MLLRRLIVRANGFRAQSNAILVNIIPEFCDKTTILANYSYNLHIFLRWIVSLT